MMIYDGNELVARLLGLKATCRSCGRSFSFEDGGHCASKNGIDDRIVVCPTCLSCYRFDMTPSALTLLEDVTRHYPQLAPASPKSDPSSPSRSTVSHPPVITADLCPACGATVAPTARYCTSCGVNLNRDPDSLGLSGSASGISPEVPIPAASLLAVTNAERPGCITAYAVLLFVVAGVLTFGGVALAGSGELAGGQLILLLALGGAELVIATGLWRMRNWARVLLLIVQGLGIAVSLASLLLGKSSSGVLAGMAVNIYIITWFARNDRLFR